MKNSTYKHKQKKRSWNKHASWYSGMTGKEGHKYHQNIAYPIVLKEIKSIIKELKNKKEIKLLDVGCGNGTFSNVLKDKRFKYTGIDNAPSMIKDTQKHTHNQSKFFVKDATKSFKLENYDFAVSIFSMQDIPTLEVIKEVSNSLNINGYFIIFMKHPAFNIPRVTGWIDDEKRKITSKRIDSYLEEKQIPLTKKLGRTTYKSIHFHRPLEKYMQELLKYFNLISFREITDSINKRNKTIPSFVLISLKKETK